MLDKIQIMVEEVTINSNKNHNYTQEESKHAQYCRGHIKQALTLNESAQRDYNFCRELRDQDDAFYTVLRECEEE